MLWAFSFFFFYKLVLIGRSFTILQPVSIVGVSSVDVVGLNLNRLERLYFWPFFSFLRFFF